MDTSAAGQARARELQSQLTQAQEALDDFTLEHAIEVLRTQLENEQTEYTALIKSQTDRIVEEIGSLGSTFKTELSSIIEAANLQANDTITSRDAKAAYAEQKNSAEAEVAAAQKALHDSQIALAAANGMNTTSSKKVFSWNLFAGGWWGQDKAFYEDSTLTAAKTNAIDQASGAIAAAEQALADAKKRLEELENNVPVFHSGGIVGVNSTLKDSEVFAKLMRGEVVVTPPQIQRFMSKTIPNLSQGNSMGGSGSGSITFAPVINLTADSITQDSLPAVENIMDKAVAQIRADFGLGLNRAGLKSEINKYKQDT
jgi:uncharacterized protein YqgV (UPF0045/DUF77 family)